MNERVALISGDECLVLGPTSGHETLAPAKEVFRYIDSNFEQWECNLTGPPTEECFVEVYEMAGDSTTLNLSPCRSGLRCAPFLHRTS